MNLINILKKSFSFEFFKDFTILSSGSFFAQIIGILCSPILSRIFLPEDFGYVGTALAFVGILSLIGSLKYDLAIVLEEDDVKVGSLIDLNICLSFLMTIFSSFIIYIFYLYDFFEKNHFLINLIPFAIFLIFFNSVYNIYNNVLNRNKKYKKMAFFQILRRFLLIFFQIIFGLFVANSISLISGYVIAVIIPILILLFDKNFKLYYFSTINELKEIAKRYYKFPLFTTPQNLLNLIVMHLPVFVLGKYFTLEIVGVYYFALKIVQVPSTFIGYSIRQVFYKEAVSLKKNLPKLSKLFKNLTIGISLIIVLPMLVFYFYGGDIFDFVFGELWFKAGVFASWMFLWHGSNVIAGPARSLFLVFEKQKLILFFDTVLNLIRVIILFYCAINFSDLTVIKWLSLVSFTFNIIIIIITSVFLLKNLFYAES